MEHTKSGKETNSIFESILIFIWGIFFLLFPFLFSINTTDAFILPKQILLGLVVIVSLIIWGAKMLTERMTKIRRTPFDVPILLFILFSFISCLFAMNRYDALIAFVPLLLLALAYFIIVNVIRKENSIFFLITTLFISAAALSLLTMLSFFKIYILPFQFAHTAAFTPVGSLLEQAMFFAFILPIGIYFAYPVIKGHVDSKVGAFSILSAIVTVGLLFTVLQLLTTQKPVLLPFETGFQTAFAAISQDAQRIGQGFFFGSGYGTFANDFTRFKQAPFNLNADTWFLTFTHSSNFVLEVLATTGLLGILTYLFLILKIFVNPATKLNNPLFLALGVTIVLSFLLPFSFIEIAILFMLMALFATTQAHLQPKQFFDMEMHVVTMKKGFLSVQAESERGFSKIIPIIFILLFIIISAVVGYFGVRFVLSDLAFQRALVAAQANNGNKTYQEQISAINLFPYRDVYYRVFSQTNLALANSLATLRKNDLSKDQQAQQTLYALIQQSINSGRTATSMSPQTVANWQNLSSVYRSLIGFGQNADQFAILSNQQAIAYDPTDPQEYIALGGLYYQLGQYDNAIREFQTAAGLKPDYANAYYNLGHALEQKNDLATALTQYQTVKTLVAKDPANAQKIDAEIKALQDKIGGSAQTNTDQTNPSPTPTPIKSEPTPSIKASANQLPLNLDQPSSAIPTKSPKAKIPGPQTASGSGQ